MSAMKTYRSMHGDLLMPTIFKVPERHDAWPQSTWGYKLGYWTSELRRNKEKLLAYQVRDLEALDFSWSAGEARWNHYFLPAMQRYRELHGSAQVPQSFVVPCDDLKWPAKLGGYRLGQKVNNLRCGNALDTTSDDEMWQEVELICKNWVMLETLHEVEASGILHDEEVDKQSID
ncbi:hypothetical protein KXD40_001957 [Peronospora effusa]|uniref:Helicase-associated domain-containing protein n=1 Tax=Peronospora effusa TaxID=542832 RepID=A0A3M6VLE4_9STRA|nr:hypothetical protein DD238_001995 [Peronospora effusa]RQM16293.1 hypothetical protein DD237_002844 [Peronospora effusa]UIZ26558.1 hypothetical protein KXD40_001957 [Peronospora effusa]